ncbi:MAG: sirohydrochlorin cobaltochelatase [Phascolarctobacterium sp.]|nr:sirohydrochlorin cobaltochelatase [Phascolarctobacterium sp.]
MTNNKALVVISFGSTFDETRTLDIGGIEKALTQALPTHDFFRAYTSRIVRRKLAERGIIVDDIETVLNQLLATGYKEVHLQPTHLLHGEEFEQKIMVLKDKYASCFTKLTIGQPLIQNSEYYSLVAQALVAQLPPLAEDEGTIFMGHGSPRNNNASFHHTYITLQQEFDKLGAPVLIGTVEDEDAPNLEAVLTRVQERNYKHVHMYPLMVVAGDHANNDMYGDEPDSWKSQIEALGISTTGHLNGIGRYPTIQALYIKHMLTALN